MTSYDQKVPPDGTSKTCIRTHLHSSTDTIKLTRDCTSRRFQNPYATPNPCIEYKRRSLLSARGVQWWISHRHSSSVSAASSCTTSPADKNGFEARNSGGAVPSSASSCCIPAATPQPQISNRERAWRSAPPGTLQLRVICWRDLTCRG